MARRSGVSIHTTTYGQFKGVDFSTDPSLVDPSRSPLSVNMIADTGGMPEKRMGWRTLFSIEAPVNGLFVAVINQEQRFIAHGGTKLYEFYPDTDGEPTLLMSGLTNSRSVAQNMGGKLWILTGGEYLVFDGTSAKNVSEIAYIPTTIIGAAPAGGGEVFENPNLVQPKRKNEFIPDGTSKDYYLDSTDIDAAEVTATVKGEKKVENTDFTVNREKGIVTFNTAPEKPVVGQEGEVIITFSKTVAGYADRAGKCRIMTTYGVGTTDRIIISGNPSYPNRDWTSGLNDPTYFPDLGYNVVGTEATAIMGYRRIGEYLAIVKEDNGQDSTVFLRSASVNSNGEAVFINKQSIAGVGAVAIHGFGNILDEQLFLSGTGVYAITTNALTAERIVQNRSFYVDPRLTQEPGLEQAEAISWNGMYLLAVNSHVYLLDGRQNKSYKAKSQSDYIYECYYWENVPAVCWLDHKDGATETLYFGTSDGKICRFNSDIETMERYSDDGAPILAVWSTKADDDEDITLLKTMIKKGNSVTIKPYTRSSAQIYFRTEQDPVEWLATEDTMDIFDWEDIDFTRFTFESNDAPREILFNTKVKKYKRLQIIVKNDAVNEGFGIYGITKHYVVGNFAKR